MQTRAKDVFTTIHVEGAILPPDLLQRISQGDNELDGLTPQSFHLLENEKITEAISRSWNRMLGAWTAFQDHLNKLSETDIATSTTREKWLLHLFRELGYGRLTTAKAIEIEGKSYPVSHMWQNTPIHLVGYRIDLDKRTARVSGAARSSPHSMVQEFLNRSDDHLWAFVSNGKTLRILRDNVSLTRQAHVEFDLQAMMDGEVYSDFVLLWLLCHQSRVEAEKPENCWLERWSKAAQEQGTRALDQLRKGVEDAITALGKGFLSHKSNQLLKEKLRKGDLDKQDYYRQLLRLVYRLIFMFVAEDRDALLVPEAPQMHKTRYLEYYSTKRIRQLALKRRGSKHADLYQGFKVVTRLLGEQGCPELALPALGSFLFSERSIEDIIECDIVNRDFLDAIRSLAVIVDSRTRRQVDYKNLGSEELGSVYESLLELHPELDVNSGHFELKMAGGNERKSTGSYYTPSSLIQVLLDSALDPVLNEAVAKKNPKQAILDLKICDPACGSGHFLIAAAHRMAQRLATVETGDEAPAPDAVRHALRQIVGHCLYGVDINEMAVELCKVGLWMEALEPGKPLSFLDHHILCGNSLLGTTSALLKKGIPDEAFKPIEGDDRKLCSQYKKQNKRERQTQQSDLFYDLSLPWNRLGDFSTAMTEVNEFSDESIVDIHAKQRKYHKAVHSSGYRFGHLLADLWCAAFVWKKDGELPYPITEDVFRQVQKNPHHIPPWMYAQVQRLKQQYQFFHWHLSFSDVFRVPAKNEQPDNEHTGWCGGFDVVLGNPPWDRIKLQEKEWFAERHPDVARAPNAAKRRAMIAQLKNNDPALYQDFMKAKRAAEGASHFIRNTGLYPLTGRGDINTYTIFAELKRHIINLNGQVGCIIPSGIATDDTTKFFFQHLMEGKNLLKLYDFENKKGIFQGVHRSYKFCLLTLTGSNRPAETGSDFVFFALDTADLNNEDRHFSLSDDEIKLINPNTRTCPIFRSKHDAEITKNVYHRIPVLIKESNSERGNPLGLRFFTVFHMTNDSHYFKTRENLESDGWKLNGNFFRKGDKKYLPLYEAKMVWHFDHRFGSYENVPPDSTSTQLPETKEKDHINPYYTVLPRYWVFENVVNENLLNNWKLNWIIGFRDITNTTNERTMISSVIPFSGVSNKFPLMIMNNQSIKVYILLIFNLSSFVFDYIVRQKMGGTSLNYYLVKQLPVLNPIDIRKPILNNIVEKALELFYTSWDLKAFAEDCGYSGTPFKWNEERRFLIRCELDAAYFHLYEIERNDVDYIMDTFPIVKRKDEQKYGEYRTKRVILEIYDEMAESMRTGKPYQTQLDPPPADPRVAHEE
ncbi:MAG: N-6 DNA methylase [candidate division KSB1 bacterium]|nr:N-6 DNA methylase [candidate division KSB1 bacterium]